jgi:hypothetical protein
LPFGAQVGRPALEIIINYALQQSLIARKIDVEELIDDTTRARAPRELPALSAAPVYLLTSMG